MNKVDLVVEQLEKRLKSSKSIDFGSVYEFILSLIKDKRFDQANNLIDLLIEKDIGNRRSQVANLLYYCYRSDEAIAQLLEKKYLTSYDYTMIAKCYLRQGQVDSAFKLLENLKKNDNNTEDIKKRIDYYERVIDFHDYEGEVIETEYQWFKCNGNTLEPGHVVYLRNTPYVLSGNGNEDEHLNFKTFVIYKMDKTGIYMIPLRPGIKNFQYNIKKEDYPIVNKDRYIKTTVCYTTEDNILSVVDKLKPADLDRIQYSLFLSYYFDKNKDESQKIYLREQLPEISEGMFIDYFDIDTKVKTRYYVIGIEPGCYVVNPVDTKTNEIFRDNICLVPKDKLIYAVFRPKIDEREQCYERIKITS